MDLLNYVNINTEKVFEDVANESWYFTEDMYYLTEPSDRTGMWSAVQFDRLDQKDGIIQVFRREDSPFEKAVFQLGNLKKEAEYIITDIDTNESVVFKGTELKDGLPIEIPEKRKAKIYFYKVQ